MTTKISILLLLPFVNLICFGQTISNNENSLKQIKANTDTLPNWNMNKTYITIDTAYILNKPIEVDGKTFNYMRSYFPSSKHIEYGNINSKKQPEGYWMYKLAENWTPVSGNASRGHKIREWGYNCAWVCKIKYRWNWTFSKTIISKKKILYDY